MNVGRQHTFEVFLSEQSGCCKLLTVFRIFV